MKTQVIAECLVDSMRKYEISKRIEQTDCLPVSLLLADEVMTRSHLKDNAYVWVTGMKKDKYRKWVLRNLKTIQLPPKSTEGSCMVDIYVFRAPDINKDPIYPLLTMESEGAEWTVNDTCTSGDCDYLWDYFKLIQVPSPLKIFVARTATKNVDMLMKRLLQMASDYRTLLQKETEVFLIVLPSSSLKKTNIQIARWFNNDTDEQLVDYGKCFAR